MPDHDAELIVDEGDQLVVELSVLIGGVLGGHVLRGSLGFTLIEFVRRDKSETGQGNIPSWLGITARFLLCASFQVQPAADTRPLARLTCRGLIRLAMKLTSPELTARQAYCSASTTSDHGWSLSGSGLIIPAWVLE